MGKVLKAAGVTAGAIALTAGVHFYAANSAETRIRDSVMASTALRGVFTEIADVSVNPITGKVVVSGLKLKTSAGTARIGKVTHRGAPLGGLISPALAAESSFTMDDVEITTGTTTISAEELVVEAASVDEDGLQELFDADAIRDVIDGLKSLSFKSIRSPEITVEQTIGKEIATTTYRDVAFEGMKNGKLTRVAALAYEQSMKAEAGPMTVKAGITEALGLDLVVIARFWGDRPNPGDTLAPAYDSSRMENMSFSIPGKVEATIGRVESGAVRLKPMATPFSSLAALAGKKPGEKQTPQEAKLAIDFLRDIYSSISDDGFEVRDIRISGKGTGAQAESRIARASGSFGGGKVPSGFKLEGLAVDAPSPGGATTVKLGSLSTEGFSYSTMLAAMSKAIDAGDVDMKKIDPRTLIPQLGTITIRGVEIDTPDPKAPAGAPPERYNIKLGGFTAGATKQINGIPTELAFALDNLALKLPENTPDDTIKQLKALGYSTLDVSAKIAAKWNEPTKELNLSEVSVGGVKMGTAKLSGSIGNIGREVFEGDIAMAQVALFGATAKSLSLKIENTGLAEGLLAMQARTQGRTADEIRAEMGTLAAMGIPAILGPSDDAKSIANAIAKFLAKPQTLTIDVTAKNAGGIGIPDIATVGNPQSALALVNVKASAN